MYRDHEFDPVSPEEQARREQEEEFARRVRREVRRMERGEAEEDLRADEEREAEERAEAEERERRERRRRSSTFWQLFSGTILVREGVSKYYPYMLTIAGMFFLSIMVMFWSLHAPRTRRTETPRTLDPPPGTALPAHDPFGHRRTAPGAGHRTLRPAGAG